MFLEYQSQKGPHQSFNATCSLEDSEIASQRI